MEQFTLLSTNNYEGENHVKKIHAYIGLQSARRKKLTIFF
jgi:hypothetical protein